jgi:hypothetical protein
MLDPVSRAHTSSSERPAMKIRVALTVEVDPEAWASEYGTDAADVREQVIGHIVSLVRDDSLGLLSIVKRA